MAFLVDVALGVGFSLLSGLLKPRKVNTSNDSVPTQQFGESVPRAWGTFAIPGVLMFSGDPKNNNRVQLDAKTFNNPEENASYALFLHSNPSNAKLIALRINGLTVATGIPEVLPLTNQIKINKINDSSLNLSRFDQFIPRFYNGTQMNSDPMISKNGFPELVYKNQCYIVIADALRTIYGGRSAGVGAVLSSRITNVVQPTFGTNKGEGNAPCTIEYSSFSSGSISNSFGFAAKKYFTLQSGFQFAQRVAVFRGAASISTATLGVGTTSQTTVLAFGTGRATRFDESVSGNNITVVSESTGAEIGSLPPIQISTYNLLNVTTLNPGVIQNAVVASQGGDVKYINVDPLAVSPLYSALGVIYDSKSVAVGVCGVNEDVIGWNNRVFGIGAIIPNSTPQTNTTKLYTNVRVIVEDLLADTGILFNFSLDFDKNIRGFSTTNKDLTTDIANLLAITDSIVYQLRDGSLYFTPYPAELPAAQVVTVPSGAHMSESDLRIEAYDTLPTAINFGYKDSEREFDTSSIRFGDDSRKIVDFSLDVTASRSEGLVYASNLLNRLKNQVVSGTLHLAPEFNVVEAGDQIIYQPLDSTGEDMRLLVLRTETGADGTVRLEVINHAPAHDTPSITSINEYSLSGNPIPSEITNPIIVDTEKRTNKIGLGYWTQNSSQITRAGTQEAVYIASLYGSVADLTYGTALLDVQGTVITGTEYYLFNTNNGEGSWIKIITATLISVGKYQVTFRGALYGSTPLPNNGSVIILDIRENTVLDDNYAYLNLIQSANLYTHEYPTRKRIVQPRLASALVNSTGVRFYRQENFQALDDDNLSLSSFPLKYWNVFNVTQNSPVVLVSSASAFFDVSIPVRLRDVLRAVEVDSAGLPITGAYENNFTV